MMGGVGRIAAMLLAAQAGPALAQAPAPDAATARTEPDLVVRGSKERQDRHCYTVGGQPAIGSLIPRKPKKRVCAETADERREMAQNRAATDRDVREYVRPMGGSINP